jgi:hypothetical protein
MTSNLKWSVDTPRKIAPILCRAFMCAAGLAMPATTQTRNRVCRRGPQRDPISSSLAHCCRAIRTTPVGPCRWTAGTLAIGMRGRNLANEVWEALIARFGSGSSDHLDFWCLSPAGEFYLSRAFQDDVPVRDRGPAPMTVRLRAARDPSRRGCRRRARLF